MARTRVFNSEGGQAVRIPPKLVYSNELEINRFGDVLIIFPARDDLREVMLRKMPRPERVEERYPIQPPIRRRD
jgi:virulence-associated protein VagC